MRSSYIALLALVTVIIFSCQREYNPENEPIAGASGDFRATIDGQAWVANKIKTATIEGGVIAIYGESMDKKSILLRVADSGVHNYSMWLSSATNAGVFQDSAINPYAFVTNQWDDEGNYGNLRITNIDTARKTMSGTFDLKVFRQMDSTQRIITSGVFTNISYATTLTPPSATDSFRVKIDGSNFSYNLLGGYLAFGKISVSASVGAAPAVGITFPADIIPGRYQYDIVDIIGQYNPSTTLFLAADTGHLVILENNPLTKRVRGTFNFLANGAFTHSPPNHQLTEGYLSVIYR
jgi:hypothetical protein